MSKCVCQGPRPVIGRWVDVLHEGLRVVGTVIDKVPGTELPKRIRIQRGALQGQVIQPSEYTFKAFLEETDIDP